MNRIVILVTTILLLANVANAEESLLKCNGYRSHFNQAKQRNTSEPVSFDLIITKTNGMVTKVVKDKSLTFTLEKVDVGTDDKSVYRQLIVTDDSIALRTENPENIKNGYPLGSQYIIKNTGEYIWDISVFEEYGKCVVPDKVF